jgi:DNA-binding NarL/FixJ family response regulator
VDTHSKSTSRRVIVVDDHPLFRAGVIAALQQNGGFNVCGEAETADRARELAEALRPDAAIIDLMLHNHDGLKLVRELRQLLPRAQIIVVSMLSHHLYAQKSIHAGANAFVSKREGPAAMMSALNHASAKAGSPKSFRAPNDFDNLSERELQVLLHLGLGKSTHEIATSLGVSIKTIETHREGIKAKLGLPHATALVATAARWVQEQNLIR